MASVAVLGTDSVTIKEYSKPIGKTIHENIGSRDNIPLDARAAYTWAVTPIIGQDVGGNLHPSPLDKAAGLPGEGEVKKTQRRLTREERARLMEALRIGVKRGYGYVKIWKMLRESGVRISKRTVEYWYRSCFPEMVRRRGRYLPRELRIRLYEDVLKMWRKGLGYRRIRRKIGELYGITLSPAVIVDWCRGVHSPYNGVRIPMIDFLEPSPELAYVIGVVVGDGCVFKTSTRSGEYVIGAEAKDGEFVEEFSRCLGRVLGREPPKPIPVVGGKLVVRVRSKTLYQLLQKPIDIKRIKPFVGHCEDCIRSFLRGFFDSEGCVDKNKGGILCSNTDIRFLKYAQKLLGTLCIETTGPRICTKKGTTSKIYGRTIIRRKNVYYIEVRAKDRLKFYKLVGFTIRRKQQRLGEYLRRRGLLETPPNQPSPLLSPSPSHPQHINNVKRGPGGT